MNITAPRTLFAFLTILLLSFVSSALGASGILIGTKLVRDADFYDASNGRNGVCVDSTTEGARLYVYFENSSGYSISVNGFSIDGVPFTSFDGGDYHCGYSGESKWWQKYPSSIANGAVGAVWAYIPNEAVDIGEGSITLTLHTSGGNINFSIDPEPSKLSIPFVHIEDDLNTLTVYVQNQSETTLTLPSGGGIYINGSYRSGTLPQTSLAPGEVVPVTITGASSYLDETDLAVFSANATSGDQAYGHMRILPSSFGVTFWHSLRHWDVYDATNHNIDINIPGANVFQDEPLSTYSMGPSVLVTNIQTEWASQSSSDWSPLMIQLTGYGENLIAGDMADIHMSHRGNLELNLAAHLSWPKPLWYLPQNAWSHSEGVRKTEDWSSLEDYQYQAFDAIGRGAKNIQWFTYLNLWEQGYDLGGGEDVARIFQDSYMGGAVANPLVWERVGRVSGVLQMLRPYIENSAPFHTYVTDDQIKLHSVVCQNNKAVIVAVDERTPPDKKRKQAIGTEIYAQQIMYDYVADVPLPAYIYSSVNEASCIDPHAGIQSVSIAKIGNNTVRLTIPEINAASVIVLGPTGEGASLQASWNQISPRFRNADSLAQMILAQRTPARSSDWKFDTLNHRVRVEASNSTSSAVSALGLPIELPINRNYASNAFRVVEIFGGATNQVSFSIIPEKDFETFDLPDIASRCDFIYGSGQGQTREVFSNGVAYGYFTAKTNTYNVIWKFNNPEPWEGTGNPWIPCDYSCLIFEANLLNQPFAAGVQQALFVFDKDGDGIADTGTTSQDLHSDILMYELTNRWSRYVVDIERAFHKRFPGESFQGQWKLDSIINQILGSSDTNEYRHMIRSIRVGGANRIHVRPMGGSLAAGQKRTYDVYYDYAHNTNGAGTSFYDPSITAPVSQTGLTASVTARETASASVHVSGTSLSITTDVNVAKILVRHLDNEGQFISGHWATSGTAKSFSVTLSQTPQTGDMIAVTPIQAGGEGATFAFKHNGSVWGVENPISSSAWTYELIDDFYTDIYGSTYRTNTPYSVDISPDGLKVAVAHANSVHVMNNVGTVLWSKNYAGRTAYVRFTPDGNYVYVAANNSVNEFTGSDWRIFKYNAGTGVEQWDKQAGAGNTYAGRTVYDMEVHANGDVSYTQWKNAVKLDAGSGNQDYLKGLANYGISISPMNNGYTYIAQNSSRFGAIDNSGNYTPSTWPSYTNGLTSAGAAAKDGTRWAVAGNTVRITDGSGNTLHELYCGRSVRALDFSEDNAYLAAGSSDGVFSLIDVSSGSIVWQKSDHSSYVTDVHFLPGGTNVVFVREYFTYSHGSDQWRYYDLVEAYDLSGFKLWDNAGPYRNQPFMDEIAFSTNGHIMAVLTGNAVRYVDLDNRVGAPVINPAGGTFDDAFQVSIAPSTPGSTIYYTTDSSMPTTNSPVYGSPFVVSTTTLVRARAYKDGMEPSSISSASFEGPKVQLPVILPESGIYVGGVQITLYCATTGSVCRYTTNGSTPTPSSPAYTGPFSISDNATVRVIAYRNGLQQSDIASASFTITQSAGDEVVRYEFEETSGTTTLDESGNNNNGAIEGATFDSSGYNNRCFRFDGNNDRVNMGGLNLVGNAMTMCAWIRADDFGTDDARIISKAYGVASSQHYWMLSTVPSSGIRLRFRLKTSGVTKELVASSGSLSAGVWTHVAAVYNGTYMILYKDGSEVGRTTCNGNINTDSGTEAWIGANPDNNRFFDGRIDDVRLFEKALTPTELQAVMDNVAETPAVYEPVIYPDGGTHEGACDITLACATTNANIYYTTDGSTPDASDTLYTGTVTIYTNTTIKAIGIAPGQDDSTVASASFVVSAVSVASPTFSPNAGGYVNIVTVQLACTTSDSSIYYTTDGSDPTESSTLYSAPLVFTENTTLKARAYKSGMSPSGVSIASYQILLPQAATPVFSPLAGIYTNDTEISISCATSGAEIWYTLNGSTPSNGAPSLQYSAPFTINTTRYIRARAFAAAHRPSNEQDAYYNIVRIDEEAPTTPTGLDYNARASKSISLIWNPASDDIAVAGYRIYRDGTQVGTSSVTSYLDSGLSPETTYSYTVSAYDGVGNTSDVSTAVQITTLQPPYGTNMLQNGSFETGMPTPQYWAYAWANLAVGSVTDETSIDGNQSFKMIITPNGFNSSGYAYIDQHIPIESGVTNHLQAWIKTEGVTAPGVMLRVVGLNGAGGIWSTAWVSGTTNWAKYELSFVAPATVSTGRVDILWDNGTGTAYVDNIYFGLPLSEPPDPDLDRDNMYDGWETINFGGTEVSDGTGDYDGDGFTDAEEFLAGTQPTNNLSYLMTFGEKHASDSSKAVILWPPANGREYSLLISTNLTDFTVLQSGIYGSSYTVDVLNTKTYYYRIQVDSY